MRNVWEMVFTTIGRRIPKRHRVWVNVVQLANELVNSSSIGVRAL
ncbi:hypothetical protein ACFKPU_23200 [Salmonella enterica subsp. enterica serovar Braenderup]